MAQIQLCMCTDKNCTGMKTDSPMGWVHTVENTEESAR